MQPVSFNSVLIIAGISVFVPVVLGLLPRLPVPSAVLEVVAGIAVGPSVLGWVRAAASLAGELAPGQAPATEGREIVPRQRGTSLRPGGATAGHRQDGAGQSAAGD